MADVQYHLIRGYADLETACCGTQEKAFKDAWLLWPKLHYWEHPSWISNTEGYTYLMCTSVSWSPDHERFMQKPIGLVELQRSPFEGEERVVWLKYITVDPKHRRQGIASRLIEMVAEHMSKSGDLLSRSYATNYGLHIQARMDKALDAAGVPWTQSRREEVGKANRTRQAVAA